VRIRKKDGRASRGGKSRGQLMLEAMSKAPRPLLTTDEIMALTRGE
jgi:hypothetical protein